MMDALLYSVRDAVRGGGFGYDEKTCEVMDAGMPPDRCGNWFVAVHQGGIRSTMDNALNELYGWSVTLTARVKVPPDRIGNALLARKLAKDLGFNRRAQQLRAFLHMNWDVIGAANNYMVEVLSDAEIIYGFCEPARFRNMETPVLVGGEWLGATADSRDAALKAELTFDDCRRLQAIGAYT